MKKTIAVAALAAGLAATPALAADKEKLPLAWYDSAGKLVGLDVAGGTALIQVGTDMLSMKMLPSLMANGDPTYSSWQASSSSPGVFFTSVGCSGPAYLHRSGEVPGTTRPSAVMRTAGGVITAYVGSPSAVPTDVVISSRLSNSETGMAECSGGKASPEHVIPVTGTINLSGVWTPPFTAR